MVGINTIILNQATMQKAVEYYLNSILLREGEGVNVVSIKSKMDNYNSTFEIEVKDILEPESEKK